MKRLCFVAVLFFSLLFSQACNSDRSGRGQQETNAVDHAPGSINGDTFNSYPDPTDTAQTAMPSPSGKNEDSTAEESMNQNDFNLKRDHSNK